MKNPLVLDDQFIFHPESDIKTVFENDNPVEVEIGCGRGTLLIHLARENPGHNFLAIEWASKFYRYTADRIRRWNLTNAKILRTDARDFVMQKIVHETIDVFHIYFPDPWPKKRHHKKRFFIPQCCNALFRSLKSGGKIYAATDHKHYFDQIELNLTSIPGLTTCQFDSPAGNEILTNWEAKFKKEGRTIYRLAVMKV